MCAETTVEHDGHEAHKHHVAVFFGNTHDYHGEDAFTVGVDYEYRLTDLLGVGVLADFAGDEIDTKVVGGGIFIHPWKEFHLLTALGNEHHKGEDEYLLRLGISYDFMIEKWSISPTLNCDLLESGKENWVYGLAIGRGF